jgi:DNA-binding CsgD family transcriptional regulator
MTTAVTIRQQQAVELLAAGHSPEEAAAILGVTARTLRRYLADGDVVKELRAIHRERLTTLLRGALNAAPEALRTLRTVATDAAASEHARVAAARAILEHTGRLFDAADIDARLDELESRLAAQEERPT